MHRALVFALVAELASCGKRPPGSVANQCASRPATYLISFAQTDGNCGALQSYGVNVNADGTIAEPLGCESVSDDGCTEVSKSCKVANHGADCTLTTSIVFTFGGAGASGLAQLTCPACASSYNLLMTRQ